MPTAASVTRAFLPVRSNEREVGHAWGSLSVTRQVWIPGICLVDVLGGFGSKDEFNGHGVGEPCVSHLSSTLTMPFPSLRGDLKGGLGVGEPRPSMSWKVPYSVTSAPSGPATIKCQAVETVQVAQFVDAQRRAVPRLDEFTLAGRDLVEQVRRRLAFAERVDHAPARLPRFHLRRDPCRWPSGSARESSGRAADRSRGRSSL